MKLTHLTLLAFILAPFTSSAVIIQQNNSSAEIGGYVAYASVGQPWIPIPFADSATAPANGPFSTGLSHLIPQPPGTGMGSGIARSSAGQNSMASATQLRATGSALTATYALTDELIAMSTSSYVTARSTFEILFEVLAPTFYQLAGFLERPMFAAGQSATLLLTSAGGPHLVDEQFSFADGAHHDFNLSGLLTPGVYRLTANADTYSYSERFSGMSGFANFDVTMDFTPAAPASLPDTGATFLLLALGMCGLMVLRFLSLRSSGPLVPVAP